MTEITEDLVREQSREIILNHASDVEYMSIGEYLADFDEFASLPEDEFDQLQGRIDKMIRNAEVTVTWRDEDGPTVEQLTARVAELESGRNQLRHVIDDQAHRIQAGLDRIAELEAELKDAKAIGEQCTATTGRRLTVQCGREAGHGDAHTAEVGGGRISWHGDTAGSAT